MNILWSRWALKIARKKKRCTLRMYWPNRMCGKCLTIPPNQITKHTWNCLHWTCISAGPIANRFPTIDRSVESFYKASFFFSIEKRWDFQCFRHIRSLRDLKQNCFKFFFLFLNQWGHTLRTRIFIDFYYSNTHDKKLFRKIGA